jgi:hypothetical protein
LSNLQTFSSRIASQIGHSVMSRDPL